MRTRNNFIRPERTIARLSRELPGLKANICRWSRMRSMFSRISSDRFYERLLEIDNAALGYVEARIRIAETALASEYLMLGLGRRVPNKENL